MSETRDPTLRVSMRDLLGEKVAHVRAATQTRKHACHWPNCRAQIPPARFACYRHWRLLPARIRNAIWRAYRPGQEDDGQPSDAYLQAAHAAQEWIGKQGKS